MPSISSEADEIELEYQNSVMYGSYSRTLASYSQAKAAELRQLKAEEKNEEKDKKKEQDPLHGEWASRFIRPVSYIWRHTFAKVGEDWVFLALLGMITAIIGFTMDYGILVCTNARIWLYRELVDMHLAVQFLAWICLPVCLVLFASGFVYLVAPPAIGSGIPEMKTILRGVVLKEYLTFRTLIAKMVGLTATLGSGMPLGKEGPLVHIASIIATLLSKLVTSFKGIYENESRSTEMLAAACAVGVSCNFGATIGGVLFSIEVTSAYFAIRNYWRGFFSAVIGSLTFRLLAFCFVTEETLTAMFRTNFSVDFAYDPGELFVYALIGAWGGLAGALFVLCHRRYVFFMRRNKRISKFLQINRFIYPTIISSFIAILYFPPGFGRYLATTLSSRQQINSLFTNFSWMSSNLTVEQAEMLSFWNYEDINPFISLNLYTITTFFLTIVAYTMPVPSGTLIPIFRTGAAFGRMIGEAMFYMFPNGINVGSSLIPIVPGGYAIVGAAALVSGATHAISVCVVVCEITGQIYHIVPVLVAVLVSRSVSAYLQPCLYDSIIMIKKLPYLPDILPSSSDAYNVVVEDFMVSDVKYIWQGMTYHELKSTVKDNPKLRSFPLVDNHDRMVLLGSIQRRELVDLITRHVGHDKRLKIAAQRAAGAASETLSSATNVPLECSIDLNAITNGVTELQANGIAATKSSRFKIVKASLDENRDSMQIRNGVVTKSTPSSPTGSSFPTSPHTTISGTLGRKFRQATASVLKRSASSPDGKFRFRSSSSTKKVTLPVVIDMTPEEKQEWEEREMQKAANFKKCHVDAAPFQLVERTSLLKVHSIFSLLGLNHAYVTSIGQLVGVVGLKELRKAIDDVNSGQLVRQHVQHSYSSDLDIFVEEYNKEVEEYSPTAIVNLEQEPDLHEFSDSESDDCNPNNRRQESIGLSHSADVHKNGSSTTIDVQSPAGFQHEHQVDMSGAFDRLSAIYIDAFDEEDDERKS